MKRFIISLENIYLFYDYENEENTDKEKVKGLNSIDLPNIININININNIKLIGWEYLKKIIRIILKNKKNYILPNNESKCYINLYTLLKNLLQFTSNFEIITNLSNIFSILEYVDPLFFEFSEYEQIKDLHEEKRDEHEFINSNSNNPKLIINLKKKDSLNSKRMVNSFRLIPVLKKKMKNIKEKIQKKLNNKNSEKHDIKVILEKFLLGNDLIIKNNKNILSIIFENSFNNINILLVFIFSPFNYELSKDFNINDNSNVLEKNKLFVNDLIKENEIKENNKKNYIYRSFLATMVITEKSNHRFLKSVNNDYWKFLFNILYKGLKENLNINNDILILIFQFLIINENSLTIYYFIKYNIIFFLYQNLLNNKYKGFIIDLWTNSKIFNLNISLYQIFWNYLFIIGFFTDLIDLVISNNNNDTLYSNKFNKDYTNPEIKYLLQYLFKIKNNFKSNKNYNKIIETFYNEDEDFDPFINEEIYELKTDIDLISPIVNLNLKINTKSKKSIKKRNSKFAPKLRTVFLSNIKNKFNKKKLTYYKNYFKDLFIKKNNDKPKINNSKLIKINLKNFDNMKSTNNNSIDDRTSKNRFIINKSNSRLFKKNSSINSISSIKSNISKLHPKKINSFKNDTLINKLKLKKITYNKDFEFKSIQSSEILKYINNGFIFNIYNRKNNNDDEYTIYKIIYIKFIENNKYEIIEKLIINISNKIDIYFKNINLNKKCIIDNLEILIKIFDFLEKESAKDNKLFYNLVDIGDIISKNFNFMEKNFEEIFKNIGESKEIKLQNIIFKKIDSLNFFYYDFFLKIIYILHLKDNSYVKNLNIRTIDIILEIFLIYKNNIKINNIFFNFLDFLVWNNYENNLILLIINSNLWSNLKSNLDKIYIEDILIDNKEEYIFFIIKKIIALLNFIKLWNLEKSEISIKNGKISNNTQEKILNFDNSNYFLKSIRRVYKIKNKYSKFLIILSTLNSYKYLDNFISTKYGKEYKFINFKNKSKDIKLFN